jgi:hypothetical protein
MIDFERIREIKRAAQGRLLAIPGVHAVGIGSKIVAGQRTDEPAIMVFVEKKRPLSELRPEEVIPEEIEGIKTDVYESEVPRIHEDTERYRPLIAGARILPGGLVPETHILHPPAPPTVIPAQGLGGQGTIGCIAKTGEASPRIIGLTCHHVVAIPPSAKPNTLTASAAAPIVTFGGSNTPGTLVVLHLGVTGVAGSLNVFYATTNTDSLNSIANAVAARITALASPGLSASATGAQVTITGASLISLQAKTLGAHADNTWSDVHTSVAGGTISVSGSASSRCAAYVNLHVGGGQPTFGVFAPIADASSESAVATAIAAAISARSLPGVSATAAPPASPGGSATVSVAGVQAVECDMSTDIRVGQPSNTFCSKCSKCCGDGIGVLIDAHIDIDIALIELDPGFVDKYRAEIQDIGVVRGIHDIHLESSGYPLKTRGATTAAVQHGTLLALDVFGDAIFDDTQNTPPTWILYHRFYSGAFSIQGGNFSAGGDSGSAVLTDSAPNSNSEVVGILFGGSSTLSVATPIQQILSAFPALSLTIETATTPGQDIGVPSLPPSAPRLAAENVEPAPVGDFARVQQEITSIPAGRRYSELIQRHFPEVQTLVNKNRRVATAWHRNGGPHIARGVLRMAQSPEEILPNEIDGKPLSECLAGIQGVFSRYGSPALAADLAEYGPSLAQLAGLTYPQTLEALRNLESE